jgi:hypothetical protein
MKSTSKALVTKLKNFWQNQTSSPTNELIYYVQFTLNFCKPILEQDI